MITYDGAKSVDDKSLGLSLSHAGMRAMRGTSRISVLCRQERRGEPFTPYAALVDRCGAPTPAAHASTTKGARSERG